MHERNSCPQPRAAVASNEFFISSPQPRRCCCASNELSFSAALLLLFETCRFLCLTVHHPHPPIHSQFSYSLKSYHSKMTHMKSRTCRFNWIHSISSLFPVLVLVLDSHIVISHHRFLMTRTKGRHGINVPTTSKTIEALTLPPCVRAFALNAREAHTTQQQQSNSHSHHRRLVIAAVDMDPWGLTTPIPPTWLPLIKARRHAHRMNFQRLMSAF